MELKRYNFSYNGTSDKISAEYYKADEVDALLTPLREVWEKWKDVKWAHLYGIQRAVMLEQERIEAIASIKKVME